MGWLHALVDVPASLHSEAARFWSAALGWDVGPPWPGHPELRSLEPAVGEAYVHLQEIGGAPRAPRVHIDLEVDDVAVARARAATLGAGITSEQEQWSALRSPGGLPFCVVRRPEEPHRAPEPVSWPEGHRSRLVQVCIDSPADVHDAELAFWHELLGEDGWAPSDSPEFGGKWHDGAGSPLQLLWQRLDEPTGPVRAHFDLGTDDLEAETARLLRLGAEDLAPGRGWHALRDPLGLAFCVTRNSPEQSLIRKLS